MIAGEFLGEARLIASRNLTPNVGAVSASLEGSHLNLTYYVRGAATKDDEEERELTAGELIAAFPEIRTCATFFARIDEWTDPPRNERIVWPGNLTSA